MCEYRKFFLNIILETFWSKTINSAMLVFEDLWKIVFLQSILYILTVHRHVVYSVQKIYRT